MIPADPADTNRQVELLKVLKRQHIEIEQLSDAATSSVPAEKRGDKPKQETFPAGSIVVRMDQPYSRVADALLDRQFWAAWRSAETSLRRHWMVFHSPLQFESCPRRRPCNPQIENDSARRSRRAGR